MTISKDNFLTINESSLPEADRIYWSSQRFLHQWNSDIPLGLEKCTFSLSLVPTCSKDGHPTVLPPGFWHQPASSKKVIIELIVEPGRPAVHNLSSVHGFDSNDGHLISRFFPKHPSALHWPPSHVDRIQNCNCRSLDVCSFSATGRDFSNTMVSLFKGLKPRIMIVRRFGSCLCPYLILVWGGGSLLRYQNPRGWS
jgi:hypothetical protein